MNKHIEMFYNKNKILSYLSEEIVREFGGELYVKINSVWLEVNFNKGDIVYFDNKHNRIDMLYSDGNVYTYKKPNIIKRVLNYMFDIPIYPENLGGGMREIEYHRNILG